MKTPKFTPVDLGPRPTSRRIMHRLNDRGTLLLSDPKREDTSFLWSKGRRLPLPDGFFARDLNNRDEVAGLVIAGETTRAAIVRGGRLTYPLPEAEADGTRVHLINDTGAALLYLSKEGYVLFKDGKRTVIAVEGEPVAMNNDGTILWALEGSLAGAVWRPDATTRIDGIPGQDWTFVTGINNSGVVSGYTVSGGPGWRTAFRVVRGKLEQLVKIPYAGPRIGKDTWYGGAALAIADSGETVGSGTVEVWSFALRRDVSRLCGFPGDDRDRDDVAALWKEGTAYNLNKCLTRRGNWHLEEAVAVNSRGQILALGWSGKNPRYVLLNPASSSGKGR